MNPRRLVATMATMGLVGAAVAAGPAATGARSSDDAGSGARTATPIQHLVVIFQENVSFDHYFGTYPWALNASGQPAFHPSGSTPTVNGLCGPPFQPRSTEDSNQRATSGSLPCDPQAPLLTANPNLSNPQRLDRSQSHTCSQDHTYSDEQAAYHSGLMDKVVEFESSKSAGAPKDLGSCLATASNPPTPQPATPGNFAVMDYYDGNTVTAMWNYANRFALSDNSFQTQFGPSTVGAVNLISGNTFGSYCQTGGASTTFGVDESVPTGTTAPTCPASPPTQGGPSGPQGPMTIVGDPQPTYDVCSSRETTAMGGQNIGDLLNAKGVSWGWFTGGFHTPGFGSPSAPACQQRHTAQYCSPTPCTPTADYIPHHEPFQYYASTRNALHAQPASVNEIGHNGQANHQYDLTDFTAAANAGKLPAVSYLKAPAYQDGHAGYSTPLDEQAFVVQTINFLQHLDSWSSTAVVLAYDDSDGWYDHVVSPILIQSQTPLDRLAGSELCGTNTRQSPPARTGATPGSQQARCGYGPRLPLLVISPYARGNAVDNTVTDQSSILRFVEDNWLNDQRIGSGSADGIAGSLIGMFDFANPRFDRLILNPTTGQPSGDGIGDRQQ
ncbi:MAG: alkaline phosphatase family protein [Candidatus Dormibacteraeota bacterium]|nr:alkaline phosphatase family protein [Candidatus Dormibacteraeota bacterium]